MKKCDQCGKNKKEVKKYHYTGVIGGEMDWLLCDECIKTWKVKKKK